jgi:hypothetical protein
MSKKDENQNSNNSESNNNNSSSNQSGQSNNETVRVAPRMIKENFSKQSPDDKKDKKD